MPRERMSRGDLYLFVAVFAVFGIVDAAYLAWEKLAAANATWCDISTYFNCTDVRTSAYSSFAGIPTATVGLVGFLILLVFAIIAFRGVERIGPWPVDSWILLFAILGAFVGFGLTLIEVFVIEAVCILCVIGFGLDLGVLVAAVALVRRARQPDAGV
jgi:uncharacterized membrane protein